FWFRRRNVGEIEHGYPSVVTRLVAIARAAPFSLTTMPMISTSFGGSSCSRTCSLSAICGTAFGETKLTASIFLKPALMSARKNSWNRQSDRGQGQRTGRHWKTQIPRRITGGISGGDSRVVFDFWTRREEDQSALRATAHQFDRTITGSVRIWAGRAIARLWRNDPGKDLHRNRA